MRINDAFRRLMTELRPGFLAREDPAALHGALLTRDREIHERITGAELAEARAEPASHLDDAEADAARAARR